MTYDIRIESIQVRRLAAVRRVIATPSEIRTAWKPALDLVWAFLRAHPEIRRGHNVFLYRGSEIDFGVEVTSPFEPAGEVREVTTPAGKVASVIHRGSYANLPDAHDAIHRWFRSTGRTIGAFSLEIYGDWSDDPAKLETTIQYAIE